MKKEVYAVIVKNRRLLLVKKGDLWFLPGGKNELEQNDLQFLFRKIGQELPKLTLKDVKHLNNFFQKEPGKNNKLSAEVFLAEVEGEIMPACGIKASFWSDKPQEYNLSKVTKKIVLYLIENGCLLVGQAAGI